MGNAILKSLEKHYLEKVFVSRFRVQARRRDAPLHPDSEGIRPDQRTTGLEATIPGVDSTPYPPPLGPDPFGPGCHPRTAPGGSPAHLVVVVGRGRENGVDGLLDDVVHILRHEGGLVGSQTRGAGAGSRARLRE